MWVESGTLRHKGVTVYNLRGKEEWIILELNVYVSFIKWWEITKNQYFVTVHEQILFNFFVLSAANISNVVITPSTTELLELHSSISLSCSAFGSFPSFLWLNNSAEVTASERVHISDGGSALTIINVTRYDQGPFTCRVFNNFSNCTSDPVTLSVSCELRSSPASVFVTLHANAWQTLLVV